MATGAKRWTAFRKAELVEQVLDNEISLPDALAQNGISADEFSGWVKKFGQGGYLALRQIKPTRLRHTARKAYGVRRAIAILRNVAGSM